MTVQQQRLERVIQPDTSYHVADLKQRLNISDAVWKSYVSEGLAVVNGGGHQRYCLGADFIHFVTTRGQSK